MIEYLESKIPQFYDVLEGELSKTNKMFDIIYRNAKKNGFINIETTKFELRERYLNATKVNPTKIFEVSRPKEKSTFSLQADLAMSMSRFVADNIDYNNVLKLIQNGTIFRDRVDNIPGYRREFKQVLLGTWGSNNCYYDAEIIYLSYHLFKELNIPISKIQLSNHNIYNIIDKNMSEKIRFSGINNIDILSSYLDLQDIAALYKLHCQNNLNILEVKKALGSIKNNLIIDEIEKLLKVHHILISHFLIKENIVFSFGNMDGTNHYTGNNYRIYIDAGNSCEVLIADGGRIDNMVNKFSKGKNIPGVCMGIGTQILKNFYELTDDCDNIIVILSENHLDDIDLIKKLEENSKFNYSIYPVNLKRTATFFKSKFYKDSNFIILKDKVFTLKFNDLYKKTLLIDEMKRMGLEYEIQQIRSKDY